MLYGPPPLAGADPTINALSAAVQKCQADFAACRYDALARKLPQRLALTYACDDDSAVGARAALFNLATRLCIKLGDDRLSAVTADRAVTTARDGADLLALAEAHRMVSSVCRRRGDYERATKIAVHAAEQLASGKSIDRSGRLSTQGNLYASAAYSAAKAGDRDSANALITEAAAVATQLGRDANVGGFFGPSQVALHQVSVHHLLGDAGAAISHARTIAVDRLPAERQARLWIDVARAFDQWDKPERCYRALLSAEVAAPQEVRRGSVRTLATGLLRHDRVLPDVRTFAKRIGGA
ncbi:XRE family transcriptional regulator [Streptomyces sp. NPDC059850]|uniref:XRE family transcriptional regulator n=1 Tax=Streptomyces sp. NPDC059850 TaxID=3346970 RepID=UPI00365240B0